MPTKTNPDDSGWDLIGLEIIEKRHNVFLFDTGIQIEPPKGYYTEIYPRSSIYKTDFIQANSVGIIDSGYRGNIMIPLRYIGQDNAKEAIEQLKGCRIAQLILRKHVASELVEVSSLTDTKRGASGFGSSGQR